MRIGYGRVSTASGEQASALRVQLSWLQEQACDRILHDIESGLNPTRPAYSQLLELLRSGQVTAIQATRADRLGRDASELVRLVQLADAAGVPVTTRDDGVLSAKTAEELLLLYVKAALAQGESMKLSQRIRGGLAQGRRLGKPQRKPCWGYQLSRDRMRFEPDPVEFARGRQLIEQLIAANWRLLPTLKAFPEPPFRSVRGLRAWILNPSIRGGIGYGQKANHQYDEILWDRHPAMLTHDEYASYIRHAKSNRTHWGINVTRQLRPLTGLCVCAECGSKMKYVSGRTIASLRCNGEGCSQLYRSTRERLIIEYTLEQLTTQAAEHMATATKRATSPEIIELERQIMALQRLADPETESIIKAKQDRLKSLQAQPVADQNMIEEIANPRWADHATRDNLTMIFHALIISITITKQQPFAIKLRI